MRFINRIAALLTRMPSKVDGIYSRDDMEMYLVRDRGDRMENYTIGLAAERFAGWKGRV